MAISGAVFDCDGTLVDSMPMWFGVLERLVANHGAVAPEGLLLELEPLTLPDECEQLHLRLGIGESGAALNDELHEMIRYEYTHSIRPFPGLRGFLESLRDAGIPMAIATSTSEPEVHLLLDTLGLSEFFCDVVCTERVGRQKDFPDVYLAACAACGTPVETTWVFEDVPFGLQVARAAGFPTVCIFNDHDGRDEGVCRAGCDVFSHEYDDVTLELLQAYGAGE